MNPNVIHIKIGNIETSKVSNPICNNFFMITPYFFLNISLNEPIAADMKEKTSNTIPNKDLI